MLCVHFLGNLAVSLGRKVCLEVEDCPSILLFVEELLKSKGEYLSVEELLVTLPDGRPLPSSTTACDVNEVRVLRMVRGG